MGRSRLGPRLRAHRAGGVRADAAPTDARQLAREGWFAPRAVYGAFPVQAQGNDLVVYDPAAYESDGGALRELARFQLSAAGRARATVSRRLFPVRRLGRGGCRRRCRS